VYTSLFHKTDSFLSPFSIWTIQNLLNNVDGCMPLTQDCPPYLMESTIGHYNSAGTNSTNFWHLSC